MRTIIIGDIHGCIEELQLLLRAFEFKKGDQIVAAGDIIGRGPDSAECLDLLKKNDAVCLLGNHEYWLLREVDEGIYGTSESKCSYFDVNGYLDYIKTFLKYYETADYLVMHAGFDPDKGCQMSSIEDLVSMRYIQTPEGRKPWFQKYRHGKHVYFGHWAALGVYRDQNVTCLDGGCVYGNELVAYSPEESRFYFVKAQKSYQPIIYHSEKS